MVAMLADGQTEIIHQTSLTLSPVLFILSFMYLVMLHKQKENLEAVTRHTQKKPHHHFQSRSGESEKYMLKEHAGI